MPLGPLPPSLHDACEPSLDAAFLSRQTCDDRDLQADLLELFVRQARAIMACLGADMDTGGRARRLQAASRLHTLCGSARAIGFRQVGDAAEGLEQRLRGQDEDDGAATGGAFRRLVETVDAACRAADHHGAAGRAALPT